MLHYLYRDYLDINVFFCQLLNVPTEWEYYIKGLKTSIKHPMFRFMLLNPVEYDYFCEYVFECVVDRKPSQGLQRYKYFVNNSVNYYDQHLSLANNTPVKYRTEKLNLEIKFRGFYGERVNYYRRSYCYQLKYFFEFFYNYNTMFKNRVPISMDHDYHARFVKPITTEQGIDMFRYTNKIFRRGGVGGNHA